MIGIFDSGLGGLTALKEARELYPGESIIYLGDTGRVPYGTRSKETIIRYSKQDVRFLLTKNVDAILVACGTVSTNALEELQKEFDIPIIGVVEPACRQAVSLTVNGKVAITGTSATVKSGAFENKIKALGIENGKNIETLSIACPLFVPLVENGFIERDNEITKKTVEHYLAPVREFGADTLILGCTHFPIIADIIADYLPGVRLVNTGKEAAKALGAYAGDNGGRSIKYYVSDDTSGFASTASLFLGYDVTDSAERIDIEKY
ncbi:MAG: glutamate racemase [Clostridia bacterium]|nr:glutamate racemase [Clostridia bacterium]